MRAAIAQLGERQTEDLKVPGSIPGLGIACDFTLIVRLKNNKFYDQTRSLGPVV